MSLRRPWTCECEGVSVDLSPTGRGDGVRVGPLHLSTPSTRPHGPDAVRTGPKSKTRPPTSSEDGDDDAGTHEQEVRRLEVAVHDALVVDRLHRFKHLLPR